MYYESESEVVQLCPTLCNPMDLVYQASLPMGFSPSKSTGVGYHFLLHGIFLTLGLNPGLPQCRQMLYPLSHQAHHNQLRQVLGI